MPDAPSVSMNNFWQAAPWVAAAGLAGGLGARALRHGVDMARYGNVEGTPVDVEPLPAAAAEMPVTVTPEEAAELRRRGIKVKRKAVHAKVAAVNLPGGVRWNLGFLDSVPAGVLGTAALVGGWKLGDMGLDAVRMHFAKDKKKQVEDRIAKLLHDKPADEDVQLHGVMKAAEDAYFAKKAALFSEDTGFGAPQNYLSALGLLMGTGGTLAALSAYNTVSAQNKYKEKAKALRAYLRNQTARPALATLQPVEEITAAA